MAIPTPADGGVPGYFGVYPAIVTDIVDPDALGRVQVRFPWLGTDGDRDVRAWATLCSPYADADQGLLALPEVDSQVVVAFEAGSLRRPYVIGACWNGQEPLPHLPEPPNNIRLLRSRADSRLEFDDTPGSTAVRITLASGHQITLTDTPSEVTVQHAGGSVVRLTATGVEIQGTTSVTVQAPTVSIEGAESVSVNSLTATVDAAEVTLAGGLLQCAMPVAVFDGVVQASAVVAGSVATPLLITEA